MMTVNPAASRRSHALRFITWFFILTCLGIAGFGWRASSASSPVPRQDADTQPPTVVLRSPVDGEVIRSGLIFTVVWQSTDNVRVDQQNISFSSDDGLTFDLSIAANLDGTVTQFEWRVPSTLRTTRGRVRVEAVDGAGNRGNATSGRVSVTGSSDQLPPSVAIISPDGADPSKSIFPNDGKANDAPSVSKPIKIEWTAVDETALASFDIAATLVPKTGQTTTFPLVIATGLAGDRRSFDWIPGPTVVSETVSLRITARDTSGNTGESITRTPFAIRNRPIIKALEYFCSTVFIYGDNFTSRTLVNLNNKNLSPFKDLIELQPTPTPGDPRGSQVLRVKAKKQRGKRGRFDDAIGAPNTVFVSDIGIFSAPFSTVGDGPRPPRIQFKTPAGDSLFKSGDEINISWEVINDDKCPIQQQELSFAQGNRGFDIECGLTDPNRRDLQIAVLDGSVRSFTWKVPQFFPGFGRLKLKATSVEGTGEAIIGTGNPLNEPSRIDISAPMEGGTLVADREKEAMISWSYVGPCPTSGFSLSFIPDGRLPIRFAEVIGETSFSGTLGQFISFAREGVVGSIEVRTLDGDVAGVVRSIKFVEATPDGGGDSLISNIQLRVQGSDCVGDSTNLALNDTVNITWMVGQANQQIASFALTFNNVPIQVSSNGAQPAATWTIPSTPNLLTSNGVLRIEARDQNGTVLGQGTRSGLNLNSVAVNATSSPSTVDSGGKVSVSGCVRAKIATLPRTLAVRVSFSSGSSQSQTVLGSIVSLNSPAFNLERTLPEDAPSGPGFLIVEIRNVENTQSFGFDIVPIQIR
ncbi:MAG: hypothetical protein HY774_09360 [Acidobacteria bacterium]|nr:hypothetical protein [Acidobacteriota bacterium]